ncbi:hypothetical protein KLP40_14675 [Hymenobacter sp. NST-14]|uniref:hypothetical protein n=1 Tax=Hymenobacter piscis TaxID=2839984 RepID=UPI001C01F146|nr:hypothetical protein [Hymenobacter piscis]MBT9394413.1 hypothetical protein [Hymenobacter piscis]
MSQSVILDRSLLWDPICFPVERQPLSQLLPEDVKLLPSDRQTAIVGEMTPGQSSIFALQSKDYTLIPNALIRKVAESVFPDHQLDVRYTSRGDFSISLILPEEINITSQAGDTTVSDRLQKTMIINNSYHGKTPFTLQGTALAEHVESIVSSAMRVSYYRLVCQNGLMGWADDYMSLDDYLQWLANGKPKKYKDAKQVREHGLTERRQVNQKRESEILVQKKFTHRALDLQWFEQYLTRTLRQFSGASSALTAQVYQRLAQVLISGREEEVLAEAGLPKMLARTALERLEKEERELQQPATLWLAYNALNYALFNSRSALNINDRYRADEAAFHQMATLSLTL